MNKNSQPEVPRPHLVMRLRALVLALGENSTPVWWKTGFMNETGLRFLERLYPRTTFRAAVHAAGTAACKTHDKAVGRIGVYHLFRLPETIDVELHTMPPSENEEFVSRFRSSLGQVDDLLEMLSSFCTEQRQPNTEAGPKRIGTGSEAVTMKSFKKIASVYYDAFKQGKPTFPYFAEE